MCLLHLLLYKRPSYFSSRLYLPLKLSTTTFYLINVALPKLFIVSLSIKTAHAHYETTYHKEVIFSLSICSRCPSNDIIVREVTSQRAAQRMLCPRGISFKSELTCLEYISLCCVYSRWHRSGSFHLDVQTILLQRKQIPKSWL